MITIKRCCFGFALVLFALTLSARAASTRVFIASNGADSGACTRTAPCKTFPYAFSQVLAKGEVIVLDTSGHAAFTINKSVTIVAAPGAYVVIGSKVANSTAVSITIGPADVVVLRGLTVAGQGVGANGIWSKGMGAVHIEGCTVSGFIEHGIFQSSSGRMYVKDTIVRDGKGFGIRMYVNSGQITGRIDHCRVENIQYPTGKGVVIGNNANVTINNTVSSGNWYGGFEAGGSGRLAISDSAAAGNVTGFYAWGGAMEVTRGTASENTNYGFLAQSGGALHIDGSLASKNYNGIAALDSGTVVRLAQTMVVKNYSFGTVQSGSSRIITRGNNTIVGNNNEGSQTSGSLLPFDGIQ